jgi:anti-anti-sigma regulatory factor
MESEQGTALRLHGELDDEACAAIRRTLAPLLSAGLRHLVLDLSEVTALPQPAVELLRSLDAHLGGLILLHPSEEVLSRLRTYDLAHLLEVREVDPPLPRPVAPPKPPERLAELLPLVRDRRLAR